VIWICGFVFYLDPKLAVGTIITDGDGRIVLVRRAIEPGYGKWVFPGGYVDRSAGVLFGRVAPASSWPRLSRISPARRRPSEPSSLW
jgi:8-oxo-dGTP pyrophosphatase MutT (NUDIX family)